ncbi:MAG TPA: DMT family transporter [Gemmatales bacterium]|nr:DMT family transporter [Gemmatales bacterium]
MTHPWLGRLTVALAAVMWSLSGFFITLLTRPPSWMGDVKPVSPEQIACWRCLFGAASLLVLLRPAMIRWHPLMLVMAGSFAIMNLLFVISMAEGEVAAAALLEYTAPFWVFLVNVLLLRRAKATQRDWIALLIATMGIVLIVLGRLQADQLKAAGQALGAGITFAGVLICLSILNSFASPWLAFVNQLVAGLVALPWAMTTPWPEGIQWVILAFFGTIQVAVPYWLMSHAMKTVPAHEASLITLLDPLLVPFWAFLITWSIPAAPTWLGGIVFLLALVIRYLPVRAK